MSFKGFLRVLLTLLIVGILIEAVYEAALPNEWNYILLGAIVAQNIIAIKWTQWSYEMLLRAHDIVEQWLVTLSQKYFWRYARERPVLNKGSTNYWLNTSRDLSFVEKLSSKVRIFDDKVKSYSPIIIDGPIFNILRGPVRPSVDTCKALIELPNGAQQQSWLYDVDTERMVAWLRLIAESHANDDCIRHQPFVKLALEELRRRARSERAYNVSSLNNELKRRINNSTWRDISMTFPALEDVNIGFEANGVIDRSKPTVRAL